MKRASQTATVADDLESGERRRLDPDRCYRVLEARDRRFDGRFFVGVLTTGVYCRPVCPARTPKRENTRFFACAAAAEDAGFRPCLRCRPETSPGTPAWLGTSATVSRALKHIAAGALDAGSVADLADRLGIGERHLRRLFVEHLGASPLSVAQSRRLLFAKKLIDETDLPMTRVALDAGFSSLRRFNTLIKKTYDRTPSELRAARKGFSGSADGLLALRIPYRPPLDWERLLEFFSMRAIRGVETVEEGTYARAVRIDDAFGVIRVSRADDGANIVLSVPHELSPHLVHIVERVRRQFDVGAEPDLIADALRDDSILGPKVAANPGVRVPGSWSGFETAVRAIVGQQVSVAAATTAMTRIAWRFGDALAERCPGAASEGLTHAFPSASVLAEADVASVGMPERRAAAVRALATAVAEGVLDLEDPVGLDETVAALTAIPGIGPWTADYVAMRALGEPDAFPAGDLVLRKRLAVDGKPLAERELAMRSRLWSPWRAYAAVYLWTT